MTQTLPQTPPTSPSTTPSTDDLVQPFQLESSHLRGRLVRLGDALDRILHRHDYPPAVAALLAEAVAVAAALATALKYDGVFTLQLKGDAAVRLLVVDVTSDGALRGYAQYDAALLHDGIDGLGLLGKGYLAFTCALRDHEERYQGIVELRGISIAAAVQHYFRQSEQLPTGLLSAVRQDGAGHWRGGCLLVQKMPREGGVDVEQDSPDNEDWTRAMLVMNTCTPDELCDPALGAPDLLFRLFHEEGVRIYDPQPMADRCRCSQERVEGMLRSLPRAEIEAMAVDDVVTVTCEFCNTSYPFDKNARHALYATVVR